MSTLLPKHLQGVLWSQPLKNLDKEKDSVYIIHQILSHGRMEDIIWLFSTYSKSKIRRIFLSHPYKDYDPARFNFVRKYCLNLNEENLKLGLYVKNTPRDIR